MQLKKLLGNTYCLMGQSLLTIYMAEPGKCVLLDSGHESEKEEILEALEREGLTVGAMLCTHVHHDHFGNARDFARRFDLPVILPLGEATACISPANMCLETDSPSPGHVWNTPSMRAMLGPVDRFIWPEQNAITLMGHEFRILHTRGHSPDHISIITPDGVCHGGDCLMAGEDMARSRFPYTCTYLDDVRAKRAVAEAGIKVFVASHRGIIFGEKDVAALVEENVRHMEECLEDVMACVTDGITLDDLCARVCAKRGIHTRNELKLSWIQCTLKAMMAYLADAGRVRRMAEEGRFRYYPTNIKEPLAIEAPPTAVAYLESWQHE